MTGETNLTALLAAMRPELDDTVYVFVTTTAPYDAKTLDPLLQFSEAEGTTLILKQAAAEAAELDHAFPCRRITLNIHSALEAVGFIAAVAARLTEKGIGTNPVAGYYHDHLFVPVERADEALAAIQALSAEHAA